MFTRETDEEIYPLLIRTNDGTIKQLGLVVGGPSSDTENAADFTFTPTPLPTNVSSASDVPLPQLGTGFEADFDVVDYEWRVERFYLTQEGEAQYELHIYVQGVDVSGPVLYAGSRSPLIVNIG